MSLGGLVSDFENAMDRERLSKHFSALLAQKEEIAAHNAELAREMMDLAAGLTGVRSALAAQLEKHDPSHPLLKDVSLVERIKKAAVSAFRIAERNLDAARDVGRTFAIPGYDKPKLSPFAKAATATQLVAELVAMRPAAAAAPAQVTEPSIYTNPAFLELQQQYAASLAMRSALSEVVRQADPDHALLKDHMLQERIRKAGISAFVLSKLDYNAARNAGASFVLPGTPGALNKNEPQQ